MLLMCQIQTRQYAENKIFLGVIQYFPNFSSTNPIFTTLLDFAVQRKDLLG